MINSDYFKTGLRSKHEHWQHLLGMQKEMACLEGDREPDGHTLTMRLCLSATDQLLQSTFGSAGGLVMMLPLIQTLPFSQACQ